MTHKVHPKAYRIKRITDWISRGYYRNPSYYLEEDFIIREFLKKKLGKIGIEQIEIERFPGRINIIISSARPGLIIGRGGEGVELLKKELEKKIGAGSFKKTISESLDMEEKKRLKTKRKSAHAKKQPIGIRSGLEAKKEIRIEIREIKNPWVSANLSAQWIAQQIEKRVHFRRVLKQALSKITDNKEIKGAKIELSGRLGGVEIARREWLRRGQLPLQTIRADIDYAKTEAYCTYGVIGIKVWIYKGEKFE